MHAALALWLLVLSPGAGQDACQHWEDLDTSVVHKSGDVILGGMFPIHSKGVEEERSFRMPPDQSRCRG